MPLGWFWQASLVPSTYSVMDMGYVDYGGGPRSSAGHHSGHTTSVDELIEKSSRPADVLIDLIAERRKFTLADGPEIDGYTLNGQSPGPAITAQVGQLVEVRVANKDVDDGVALHWHGIDVPNAEDGVAGVTQDAIAAGEDHVYRFIADKSGTYWYHSHQVSHEQVARGLFGSFVVLPATASKEAEAIALAHTYSGIRTLNGKPVDASIAAATGDEVRVRVINTDNGPMKVWTNSEYRVAAIDGWDLNEPTPVSGKSLTVTAGGRADLIVTSPARIQVGGATAMLIAPEGSPAAAKPVEPASRLDLLSYGSRSATPLASAEPDREFVYSVGRKPGFVDGRPGFWWTINGHLFPDVPMFMVREGDVVRMRIDNNSGDVHPMHLHGHHALVLSRNGRPSTGSPWWTDSLNVEVGESYVIAFNADNPGVWMDHCHNLVHAAEGLVAHLMYEGVSTPYKVGGKADNSPE